MTLPFHLPDFNLVCDIWHTGTPTTDPPDRTPPPAKNVVPFRGGSLTKNNPFRGYRP